MTTTDTNLEEGRNIFWGSYWEECQDRDLVLSFPGHHEALVAVSLNFKSAHGVHTPQFLPRQTHCLAAHTYIVQFSPNKNMGTWL